MVLCWVRMSIIERMWSSAHKGLQQTKETHKSQTVHDMTHSRTQKLMAMTSQGIIDTAWSHGPQE